MGRPKIMLVTPTYHCGVLESAGNWLPLALVHLAGELDRQRFEVVIYDAMTAGVDLATALREISRQAPALVAVGAYTASTPAALALLRGVKEQAPATVTVLGGVHATFCWPTLMEENPFLDYIVVGEGEESCAALVAWHFSGQRGEVPRGVAARQGTGVKYGGPRGLIANLDALRPAYHLLDWSMYHYAIMPGSVMGAVSSSRGCTEACSFCSQQKFWERTWRAISPLRFEQLVREQIDRYGVNVILIPDERPTYNRERWVEILDRMIRMDRDVTFLMETTVTDINRDADLLAKYRQAGIVHIYVGVEAAAQSRLNEYNKELSVAESQRALKLLNDAGIVSETSFVLGTPGENPGTIAEALAQAKKYNPDFAHFLLLAPWPYSDLYAEVKPFIEEWDLSHYNLVEPVIRPRAMTRDEIFAAVLRCYRDFYMGKLVEITRMADPWKRNYLLQSMKVMMGNSFLTKHLKELGELPAHIMARMERVAAS